MTFEHQPQQIELFPYPNRGGAQGQSLLLAIRFGSYKEADSAYREWSHFLDQLGKEEGIGLIVPYAGIGESKLRCLYCLPHKQTELWLHPRPERESGRGTEAGIGRVQMRIRELCSEQSWKLVDFAEMQARVDTAFKALKKKGHRHDPGEVREVCGDGRYGLWVNTPVSSVPDRRLSVELAMKRALEEGPTRWWTVEEIEEYATDPESSRLFAQAMKDMGFRPHKTIPGRWVRAERRW